MPRPVVPFLRAERRSFARDVELFVHWQDQVRALVDQQLRRVVR